MSVDDVLAEIEPIFRDLFEDYDGPVTAALDARSVDQWDSLANVQLVVMIEKQFGVRFTTQEIGDLTNLGDMAALIIAKGGKAT